MKKILNVIVFYDNYDEIYSYLEQINNISNNIVDIALVVNRDTFNKIDMLKSEYNSRIKLFIYDFDENVGYLNAYLKVINIIDTTKYKFTILSNTDIIYSHDFYNKLINKSYDEDIGCIAPSIFSTKTNSFSNPHYVKRIKKNKLRLLTFIYSSVILSNLYMKLSYKKASTKKNCEIESCYVYSPHGSFMIYSNKFTNYLKGDIYGVKMYSEESYIGEKLRLNNLRCFYDSSLKLTHNESSVTSTLENKQRFTYIKESLIYIMKTFYTEE